LTNLLTKLSGHIGSAFEKIELNVTCFVCSDATGAGLLDGIIPKQKKILGYIFDGFGIEYIGLFCGHLEYIFYKHFVSFWQFRIIRGHLVFFPVLVCCTE
jgi:hypothetical protein